MQVGRARRLRGPFAGVDWGSWEAYNRQVLSYAPVGSCEEIGQPEIHFAERLHAGAGCGETWGV